MTAITQCRACGSPDLELILSLGQMPLANSLLSENQLAQPENTYPLDLVFCHNCALVQITETVDPEVLFSHYLYFSSFSDTMITHANEITDQLIHQRQLTTNSLVVEIASNDGYLLKNYANHKIPVLGIEPAQNIAKFANEHGINTRVEFFGLQCARNLRDEGIQADIIHAHNVLAHVADLNGVVEGMAVLLKETGLAVIETPYVKELIDHTEFDTIYHEHLCYFSITTLDHLFRSHKLYIVHVERTPIHGGSLTIFASPVDTPDPTVIQLLAQEKQWGVDKFSFYACFGDKVRAFRQTLCAMIEDLKQKGASIAVYGASAKGSTLLNYFSLDKDSLDFVVDRSTAKQGLYTPGTHLPVLPPEKLLEARPDYVLLLTWNFADEILQQQEAYRRLGGKFILPIPEVKIV